MKIRELNTQEIEAVNAGWLQYVGALFTGLGGSYAYDSMGGKEGIDGFLDEFADANAEGARYERYS